MTEIPPELLHEWLGIPANEANPSHYRLLGLAELEPDPTVIEFVAGWRIAFVEGKKRLDEHAAVAKRLLFVMRTAQHALLEPARKLKYDRLLQAQRPELSTPRFPNPGDDARNWLGVVCTDAAPAEHLLLGITADETNAAVLKSQFDQRMAMLRDLERAATDDEQRRASKLLDQLAKAELRIVREWKRAAAMAGEASPPTTEVAASAMADPFRFLQVELSDQRPVGKRQKSGLPTQKMALWSGLGAILLLTSGAWSLRPSSPPLPPPNVTNVVNLEIPAPTPEVETVSNDPPRSLEPEKDTAMAKPATTSQPTTPMWSDAISRPSPYVVTPLVPQPTPELTSETTPEFVSKSTGMRLVLIPEGTFKMGAAKDEASALADEKPQHNVRLTRPFYVGVYEVTQREYTKIMKNNPSQFAGDGNPVEKVSWYDALEFCNKLSAGDGFPHYYALTNTVDKNRSIQSARVAINGGAGYRLPTEAEWEYAASGGDERPSPFGFPNPGNANVLDANSRVGLKHTTKIGSYKPNEFGLFDTVGNVYEWCQDNHDPVAYAQRSGTVEDPLVNAESAYRVIRGGSWNAPGKESRSAHRSRENPDHPRKDLGFRVVRFARKI